MLREIGYDVFDELARAMLKHVVTRPHANNVFEERDQQTHRLDLSILR
jgi:hypothetical protein